MKQMIKSIVPFLLLLPFFGCAQSEKSTKENNVDMSEVSENAALDTATFGAGCFLVC